jgi:hypothetical protein
MPDYRCTGRDVHLGHPREWWVTAASEAEAREFSLTRGLLAEAVVEADAAARPLESLLMRVPAPEMPPGKASRRLALAAAGVGIAMVIFLAFLWTMRAREHLGRGRPPIQQLP